MGNNITDELITTVQSIVGQGYSKMDVVRALHVANNDATAAFNIIFDTPSFKRSERPKGPRVSSRNGNTTANNTANTAANARHVVGQLKLNGVDYSVNEVPSTSRSVKINVSFVKEAVTNLTRSGKWWLVGCSEVVVLSTCKGRKIKAGEQVNFTFPRERSVTGPSPGKFGGGGRGRQPVFGDCEIGRIPNEWSSRLPSLTIVFH